MADSDPTFHADADPDPNVLAREKKKNYSKSKTSFVSKISQNKNDLINKITQILQ